MNNPKHCAVSAILMVACLVAVAAVAQPPDLGVVMDNMVDAKIIKGVDYSFLAVAYDETDDVLYFATVDGENFDPTMKSVYSVPIAAINNVNVISNSDVVTSDGRHLSRGCTLKLDAKEADFGWAGLAEGWVSDGKFAVAYDELVVEPSKTANIGYFECDHARMLQEEFHKLRKQEKKGE